MTETGDLSRLRDVERAILERAPEHDLMPSLDRIREVCDLLGSPQRGYPVVHVAGTNGKTSTTRMVDALLREFGLRTGRFTSPHLHTVRERISFDGQPIDAGAVRRDVRRRGALPGPRRRAGTTSGCRSSRC